MENVMENVCVECVEDVEIDPEERELQEAVDLLQKRGFSVDWKRRLLRRGREKVYFMSEANLKKMLFFLHDMFLKEAV